MKIPKTIHQIWIGELPPPTKWMRTWKENNPDWSYVFWGNKELYENEWINQEMIDHYLMETEKPTFTSSLGSEMKGERAKLFQWHVIADIMRYEILFNYGGFMPGADRVWNKPIGDFFGDEEIFTYNTGHLHKKNYLKLKRKKAPKGKAFIKLKRYDPLNCSPIHACIPKHPFLKKCIEELPLRKPWGEAVDTTGNVFMGDMLRKYGVPDNMRIDKFEKENDYSIHYGGTTHNVYYKGCDENLIL